MENICMTGEEYLKQDSKRDRTIDGEGKKLSYSDIYLGEEMESSISK